MNNSLEYGNRPSLKDRFTQRAERATTIHSVSEKALKASVALAVGAHILGSPELGHISLGAIGITAFTGAVTAPEHKK